MRLGKASKQGVIVVLATVFLTASAFSASPPAALATPHPTDKYGEGEGWIEHAHYDRKKDRTLCEAIEIPSAMPGDKTKHRHVKSSRWEDGYWSAKQCAFGGKGKKYK
jgi:hypothetical protein